MQMVYDRNGEIVRARSLDRLGVAGLRCRCGAPAFVGVEIIRHNVWPTEKRVRCGRCAFARMANEDR
jgi:hypothetical protein